MGRFSILCVVFTIAILSLAGCDGSATYDVTYVNGKILGGEVVEGSGVLTNETRELPKFSTIVIRAGTDVLIKKGDNPSVTIEADDNLIPLITTNEEGGTLHIGSAGSYSTKNKISIVATTELLRGLELSGSGDCFIDSVADKNLSIVISGSGDVGGKGEIETFDGTINGSGDFELRNLKSTSVKVDINGSGSAKVTATKSIIANIRGSGDVRYYGNPSAVKKSVHGSGSVRKGD